MPVFGLQLPDDDSRSSYCALWRFNGRLIEEVAEGDYDNHRNQAKDKQIDHHGDPLRLMSSVRLKLNPDFTAATQRREPRSGRAIVWREAVESG